MALPHHPVGLPAFPRWSQETPRWVPLAFGFKTSSGPPPLPNGLAIPGVRLQLPARFLLLNHESPTDACLGRHPALDRSPASRSAPAAPGVGATRVTFWKSSSLKPCVRSPQHTGWHPLPFPLHSHTSLGCCPLPTVATRTHPLCSCSWRELPRWSPSSDRALGR